MLSPIKSSPSLDNYVSSPRSPYQLLHFSDVEESSNENNVVATDAVKDLEIIQTTTSKIEYVENEESEEESSHDNQNENDFVEGEDLGVVHKLRNAMEVGGSSQKRYYGIL